MPASSRQTFEKDMLGFNRYSEPQRVRHFDSSSGIHCEWIDKYSEDEASCSESKETRRQLATVFAQYKNNNERDIRDFARLFFEAVVIFATGFASTMASESVMVATFSAETMAKASIAVSKASTATTMSKVTKEASVASVGFIVAILDSFLASTMATASMVAAMTATLAATAVKVTLSPRRIDSKPLRRTASRTMTPSASKTEDCQEYTERYLTIPSDAHAPTVGTFASTELSESRASTSCTSSMDYSSRRSSLLSDRTDHTTLSTKHAESNVDQSLPIFTVHESEPPATSVSSSQLNQLDSATTGAGGIRKSSRTIGTSTPQSCKRALHGKSQQKAQMGNATFQRVAQDQRTLNTVAASAQSILAPGTSKGKGKVDSGPNALRLTGKKHGHTGPAVKVVQEDTSAEKEREDDLFKTEQTPLESTWDAVMTKGGGTGKLRRPGCHFSPVSQRSTLVAKTKENTPPRALGQGLLTNKSAPPQFFTPSRC